MSTTANAGRARFPGLPLVACRLIVFAVLIGLGTWQVQRLHWKEALIATIDERIAGRAAAASRRSSGSIAEDRRRRLLAGCRAPAPSSTTASGISSPPGTASPAFTSIRRCSSTDGRSVFVNRGFVPYDQKDAATRAAGPGRRASRPSTAWRAIRLPASRRRWCPTTIRPRTSSTGRICARWRHRPACDDDAASCRSSSMPIPRPIPAACRWAA